MIRKARAVWRGSGRSGNGDLSSDSGVLANTPYSFRTRFESEKGTNPEELIAAAHAGCFTMALAFRLQDAGYTPNRSMSCDQPQGRKTEIKIVAFRLSRRSCCDFFSSAFDDRQLQPTIFVRCRAQVA